MRGSTGNNDRRCNTCPELAYRLQHTLALFGRRSAVRICRITKHQQNIEMRRGGVAQRNGDVKDENYRRYQRNAEPKFLENLLHVGCKLPGLV
jgi:hypothetical protein